MSSAAFERPRSFVLPEMQGSPTPLVVRGSAEVLHIQPALEKLASRCGQTGAMDDLDYFLARPQIRKKTPCLVTLARAEQQSAASAADELEAAVLLYEHQIAGYGIRIFATDDTTGRRTLVSPSWMRAQVALTACHRLLTQGAQCILISFRHDEPQVDASLERLLEGCGYACRWASREREIVSYLPLESTFDATLALMGARTRNHLRYYRRKAEKQLGCVFVPDATISREEFMEMNRTSAYPVPDEMAAWRYDSRAMPGSPLFYGMRDRDGRWLSLMGGRHVCGNMEMYWQMNRDLPEQSIGTAMRSMLIEHEVKRGTRRMYVEGGTTHSMSHAFVRERSTDLIVMRESSLARIIPALVKRFLPPENMLLQVLEDKTLEWKYIRKH